MFLKRCICIAVVLGLMFIVPISCTSQPSQTTSPSPTSTSPSPSSSSPSPSPTVTLKKEIRFVDTWSPPQIDPALGQDFGCSTVYANVYDSLVFPTTEGAPTPQLAEKWDVSTDGLTYTFTLRKGVKFHNGDELTSDDVVFSAQRLVDIGQGFAYLFAPYLDNVVATDPLTVKFTLKKPFGPFPQTLVNLYILNKKQVMANIEKPGDYGDKGDYGKKWLITNDAGCGPYKVREMKLQEHLIADRFEDYWKPLDKNAPDSFTFVGTNEPVTIRTLMANRELEICDQWESEENIQAMASIPGVKIAAYQSGSVLPIQLNCSKPPTDDIHFRKALAYSYDYAALLQGVYPGAKQARGPVSSAMTGFDPDLMQYSTNLDKALEELKQSKYYGELDKYPVDVGFAAEWTTAQRIALNFQASAAKIGITINIAPPPAAKLIADISKVETTPHAVIWTVAPHYGDAGSPLSRYHSSNQGTTEQMEWLNDPEVDSMIVDALSTVNEAERTQKYYRLQEKLVDLCPTLWLVDVLEKRAYQAGYVDWGTADRVNAGGKALLVQGYNLYMPDFKVFPEKMP